MQQERYSLETNIEIQNVFKLEIFKNEREIEILILCIIKSIRENPNLLILLFYEPYCSLKVYFLCIFIYIVVSAVTSFKT